MNRGGYLHNEELARLYSELDIGKYIPQLARMLRVSIRMEETVDNKKCVMFVEPAWRGGELGGLKNTMAG